MPQRFRVGDGVPLGLHSKRHIGSTRRTYDYMSSIRQYIDQDVRPFMGDKADKNMRHHATLWSRYGRYSFRATPG